MPDSGSIRYDVRPWIGGGAPAPSFTLFVFRGPSSEAAHVLAYVPAVLDTEGAGCLQRNAHATSSVPLEQFERWYVALRSAAISAAPDEMFALDATRFRLEIQGGLNSVRLEWMHRLPPEWSQCGSVIDELHALGLAFAGDRRG
jgi:hypothetical protein